MFEIIITAPIVSILFFVQLLILFAERREINVELSSVHLPTSLVVTTLVTPGWWYSVLLLRISSASP